MSKFAESLRSLPSFEAPADGWQRLQGAVAARPRRRTRGLAAGTALAASVLLAFAIIVRPDPRAPSPVPTSEVARLMQRSQGLERDLNRLRPQVAVWDARHAARAQAIEDRIAIVDLQLNYAQPSGAKQLWQDRVALLGSLVETHRAATLTSPPNQSEEMEWSL